MKPKTPILPPKIPQPIKPPQLVTTLVQAVQGARNITANPDPNSPQADDARARLLKLHAELKEIRKAPPDDLNDKVWAQSLMKTLDETLDLYFKKVGVHA